MELKNKRWIFLYVIRYSRGKGVMRAAEGMIRVGETVAQTGQNF